MPMGATKSQVVRVSREFGITHLRLSRSERYNALDAHTLHALHEVLAHGGAPGEVLVLSSEGSVFSVGPDIAELAGYDAAQAASYSRLAHDVVAAIERWPGVTIAHLEGYCLGSALELALACDVLVGAPGLRLGLPGLAWALVPCMGGLSRLALRVASDVSCELFLNGEVFGADRAARIGLLDRIIPDQSELTRLCADLGEFGPHAVQAIRGIRLDRLGRGDCEGEAQLFARAFASGEAQRRLRQLLAG